MSYVQCTHTRATCGQYACDLTTRAHLDAFTGVLLVLVVSIDIPNISRRASKPSQDKDRLQHRKERRELDVRQKTAELERLIKPGQGRGRAGGETRQSALPRLPMHEALLFIVDRYIANMQYILYTWLHCCLCNTKNITQLAHAHPTMHCICLAISTSGNKHPRLLSELEDLL